MQTHSGKPSETRRFTPNRQRAAVVPIESRISILRHQKVILDTDLAEIYGVPVKRLNQQVNRNRSRFPADFMFPLKAPRVRRFEVAICNLKRRTRWPALASLRLH